MESSETTIVGKKLGASRDTNFEIRAWEGHEWIESILCKI